MEKIRKIIKEVVKREIYYKKRRDLYKQSIQNLTEGTRKNFNYSLYANIWDDYYDDITGKKQERDVRKSPMSRKKHHKFNLYSLIWGVIINPHPQIYE